MLEARAISVSYGAHRALGDVSVQVAKGEICVILGANGAGKSSLLKAIAGVVPIADGGTISMGGVDLAGKKSNRIVEAGIALVPEGRGIFGGLSVAENLRLGAYANRARGKEAANMERVLRLFPKLAERAAQDVRTLSGGEQQMVAIGRALMSNPDILMLDEPSLGLSPLLSADLFSALVEIGASGTGILLVEQNARLSLKIAARGYLLENGRITGEGAAEELSRDRTVIRAYLGGGTIAGGLWMGSHAGKSAAAVAGRRVAQLAARLAARADYVRASDQHTRRTAAHLPSAFAGRYDPANLAEPEFVPPLRAGRQIADTALKLSHGAIEMARKAQAQYLAYHRIHRKTLPLPERFISADYRTSPLANRDESENSGNDNGHAPESGNRRLLSDMAAEFARKAEARTTARSPLPRKPLPGSARSPHSPKAPGHGNGASRPPALPH